MKWPARWLSQEGIGRDSSLRAWAGGSGRVRPEQVCPALPAWRSLVSERAHQWTQTLFSSGPTWCAPGCCRLRGARGGATRPQCFEAPGPGLPLLYFAPVALSDRLPCLPMRGLASASLLTSGGMEREIMLRAQGGGEGTQWGAKFPFPTKEGERERKWIIRPKSLAEQGGAPGGSLDASRC